MGSSSYERSYHSGGKCIYLVNVRFVLFHRYIDGRAQSTMRFEFELETTLREVMEYFREESTSIHRGQLNICSGNFSPRLAYAIGRENDTTFPLSDSDLQRPLSDLIGNLTDEVNTLTILADIS
uniref:DUF1902 domain-containing protein n=1 Tax=Angiostrongylus cantonensis TaxID=6313 RepID=A0A0K0CY11_ANGCA